MWRGFAFLRKSVLGTKNSSAGAPRKTGTSDFWDLPPHAGNFVSAAVEPRRQCAGAELLGIVDIELVEPGIGGNQPPARKGPPVRREFHATVHGARHIKGEIQKPCARRLGDELVAEELIETGHAELHGPVRREVRANIEADIGL